jgi:Cobalamin biosynthesis protein CbiG
MKHVVCYSFTEKGKELGEKISLCKKYKSVHFYNAGIKGGIHARIFEDFKTQDALIFISSTGIAVRMIKDYIKDKTCDPAVIVIDDTGKFVIPLLSGHIGGANGLAEDIAAFIGGQCVITTASDNRNIQAGDLFAQKNGYTISSIDDAKKITSLMVNGKTVGFYSDYSCKNKLPPVIHYPALIRLDRKLPKPHIPETVEGVIIVSQKKIEELPPFLTAKPFVRLVPRTLNVGIGLKKGADKALVREAVKKALSSIGKDIAEIRAVASIDIKKEEKGLIEFAKEINAPLSFFPGSKIRQIENRFSKSQFVKDITGVYNVSASCASLLGGTVILDKFCCSGVTVSAALYEGLTSAAK